MLVMLTSIIVLFSCGEKRPSTDVSHMQQTMDSLKMWYAQMEGDSMNAASMRIKDFLDQHPNDKSEPMRRLRAEWLKARGVYFTAIKGQPDSGIVYTERALEEMKECAVLDDRNLNGSCTVR